MSGSTTMIAELPKTNSAGTNPVNNSHQTGQIHQIPQRQSVPVSTQQISNEFYGNISGQTQFSQQPQGTAGEDNLNYQPINLHPNPYGTPQVSADNLALPEPSPQRNQQQMTQQTNYTIENMPQQTLPSRDVQITTLDYQQDERIQPNHIPSVKLTSDYIKEYETTNEEELRLHRQQKYRQEAAHDTISDFQIPILVAVLYFIFQMPIINTLMRKYLSFANLYSEDGNFKLSGLLFKSTLFGGLCYLMQTISTKISNI
jgi:hypothetical protein